VDDLNKALDPGYDNPPTTGGGALRVESLENTLKVVTYQMKHLRFWPVITKLPAYSTVEEYNRLENYGNTDAGGFFVSGGLPETQDTGYSRQVQLVKFLGVTKEVTHPMTLVRPAHGDVIALETRNGMMYLLNKLERALFYGNASLISLEFDGIEQQIAAANVIDLRGATLTEAYIEEGTNNIAENYGTPTDFFLGLKNMSDLVRTFYPKERYNLPAPADGRVGLSITNFMSQVGPVAFQPDVFITPGGVGPQTGAPPSAATSPNAPNAPTVGAPAAAGSGSQLAAGTYDYQVTAVNSSGESVPSALAGSTVATAGQSITTAITKGAGADPDYYRIYRSDAGASPVFLENLAFTASPMNHVDDGSEIAGTRKAFLIQNDTQGLSFKQLAPAMKLPLAVIAASIRWIQLLYGVPIVYAPAKHVIFKNIGELAVP
jgi:hypothetical protein